ncbi:2-hydroxyacid dehydrogenase [Chelatococcus composti]|jgi:glyoxylate/hydroxypyruvate reductase A|uniref:Glyoxylate/hydroxypyruvate reductase A n=1 Tax=Chelatococcus composti TaxID=1743235 RepID=A0A841K3W2_9HYPH|nr:glyoxylate/hydroxypyruvate reductase A [Chelatococcus composti]MBB6167197.1 glyoxylate/hydroxypyruvate reductase A [Chelatococcus composti]MBS7735406.1 glyoxylate/hydroxypyruvate reductase A [Chelatococcus composti]PZN43907.1 MAG: glyoxylate/hydroxypyruvate reductase A [Pseudomonadota bacterium]GGG30020.1 glyoxylate/hydroxypyruvate reductase A [Chelatococcus composti]
MTILVALTGWHVDSWVERLQRLLPGRRVVRFGEAYDPAEIIYGVAWKHPPGAFRGLPNLKAIFSLGAGVDHLMGDPDLPDVPIARVVDHDLTNRMSEYVVLHCLMHLRQQRRYDAQQRAHVWEDDRHQPAARDVRVGIMGLGVLGQDAARKLAVMGFDVAGWSRTPKDCPGLKVFTGEAERAAFLARTDILVLLLPLTPETRGIANYALFRGLARDGRLGGPVFINAGRGGLQVEEDILRALDDGTLLAASLDVFETEPLPDSSRFWDHPSVIVTPHNAAMSDPESVVRLVARQIARLEAGEPLEHLVDRQRGY